MSSATTGISKFKSLSSHLEPFQVPFLTEKGFVGDDGIDDDDDDVSVINSNVVVCIGPKLAFDSCLFSLSSFFSSLLSLLIVPCKLPRESLCLDMTFFRLFLMVSAAKVMTICSFDVILRDFMSGLHSRYLRYAS